MNVDELTGIAKNIHARILDMKNNGYDQDEDEIDYDVVYDSSTIFEDTSWSTGWIYRSKSYELQERVRNYIDSTPYLEGRCYDTNSKTINDFINSLYVISNNTNDNSVNIVIGILNYTNDYIDLSYETQWNGVIDAGISTYDLMRIINYGSSSYSITAENNPKGLLAIGETPYNWMRNNNIVYTGNSDVKPVRPLKIPARDGILITSFLDEYINTEISKIKEYENLINELVDIYDKINSENEYVYEQIDKVVNILNTLF